jgi:hypothetical protein
MLAQTITSYTERNMYSKIGVQGAMLVGTNETITARRLRMTLTKRAKKGEGERGRMSLPMSTMKALREKSSHSCDVVPTCNRPLEAYVLKPKGC